jgi:hypothetical protein
MSYITTTDDAIDQQPWSMVDIGWRRKWCLHGSNLSLMLAKERGVSFSRSGWRKIGALTGKRTISSVMRLAGLCDFDEEALLKKRPRRLVAS